VENLSEEFFFEEHTIHLEIFCFEHSDRFFVPPKLFCYLRLYLNYTYVMVWGLGAGLIFNNALNP